LIVPLDYTATEAIDLDHILTILRRILTGTVRIGPAVAACGPRELPGASGFYLGRLGSLQGRLVTIREEII
jgi:hypothetical protein